MDDDKAEYSLADLVQDPLIALVMKSDGVDPRTIELLFEQIARQRRPDPVGPRNPVLSPIVRAVLDKLKRGDEERE